MCRGKSYAAAKSRTGRLGLEKKKRWQGANPRPIDLKASALPLHHSNLWFIVSYLMISALKFKRLTSTPLRHVGPSLRYIIYKMGIRRLKLKAENRGSTPASPFSFSDVDIGDAFQIIIQMPVASCLLSLTYD